MSALKRPEESEIGRNNSLELELQDLLSDPTTYYSDNHNFYVIQQSSQAVICLHIEKITTTLISVETMQGFHSNPSRLNQILTVRVQCTS